MGFGLGYLKASSTEGAKAAAAEVSKLEAADASPENDAPQQAPAAAPARPSGNVFGSKSSTELSSQAPSAPAGSPVAARPSFAAPSRPVEASGPKRPSFGAPAATETKGQGPRQDASSRPSFAGGNLPNARGVFVKNPAKFGQPPGASPAPASSAGSQLSAQALFEIVCTHRNMSRPAIEAAKAQAHDNPEAVMSQMRRIYDQEIAPSRLRHASDLPKAKEDHPDKVVFLLRKDDKERMRIMPREAAEKTGEILLHGATVENIHAASSPFLPPQELFAAIQVEAEAEVPAAAPSEPAPRSPRP